MAKMLNLDALAQAPKREVVLKGKTYAVKEMSVEDFIEMTKEADKLEATKAGTAEHLEATINLIMRALPEAPVKEVRALSIEHMGVLVRFIQNEMDELEAAAGTTEGAVEGNE